LEIAEFIGVNHLAVTRSPEHTVPGIIRQGNKEIPHLQGSSLTYKAVATLSKQSARHVRQRLRLSETHVRRMD